MAIFINPEDALKFIEYLYQIRQLGERTVKHYLSYYNKLNPERIDDEDYVSSFIIKHGNNSVVRGMMKNYLEMKELPVILPKRAKGNKVKKLIRTISQKEIVKVREYLYNKNFKHGLIFDLIHQGALRRAEVPTIKIGSFKWVEWIEDVDKMCKLIVLGKGNKERIVLIKPEIVEKLLMKLIPNGTKIELLFILHDQNEIDKKRGDYQDFIWVKVFTKGGNLKAKLPLYHDTVYGGKYTVIQDNKGGLKALRYGEEWRDCCGDGLILALAQEVDELRQKIEDAKNCQPLHLL